MQSTAPHRGEIWFVFTPGQPYDPHQQRPALIVSEDRRNRARDHVAVIPIFSAGQLGPSRVPIEAGAGGIHHDGVLFCEEITTLHQDFLAHGPLGSPVPRELLDRALRGVRRALGEAVPEPSH